MLHVIAFVLIAAALIAGAIMVMHATRFTLEHDLRVIVARLLITGQHLDGVVRNDRTFTRDATRPLDTNRRHAQGSMSWWATRASYKRIATAWSAVFAVMFLVFVPGPTEVVLAALAALAVFSVLLRAGRWLHPAARYHRNKRHKPTAAVLAVRERIAPETAAGRLWMNPHPELAAPGDELATYRLPDHFQGDRSDHEWYEIALRNRSERPASFDWPAPGTHPPVLRVLCAAEPPAAVPLAAHLDGIEALSAWQTFLGMGALPPRPGDTDEGRVILDSRGVNPSIALNGRQRSGKTNILYAVAAPAIRRGDERFVIIDPKGTLASLAQLAGLPGVAYVSGQSGVGVMADAIHALRMELDEVRAGNRLPGQLVTLIIDELNSFHADIRIWWQNQQPGRAQAVQHQNPVYQDINHILSRGAAFGYRMIVAGQNLSAEVLFGRRDEFSTILFTSFTDSQWQNIAGCGQRVPAKSQHQGRVYLTCAGEYQVFQAVAAVPGGREANDRAWREYAAHGYVPDDEPTVRWSASPAGPQPVPGHPALPGRPSALAIGSGPSLLIGLAAAARHLGLSLDVFKQRRQRSPGHRIPGEVDAPPGSRDKLAFPPSALRIWDRNWRDKGK